MKKVIVFDLDGTLVHTEVFWLPILEKTLEVMEAKYQCKRSLLQTRDALSLLGKVDREVFGAIFPGRTETEYLEMIDLANEVWAGMVEAHPYSFYPQALDMVKQLHRQGFELYVASNCDKIYLEAFLNLGLRPLLAGAACAGGYPGLKKWEFTRKMLDSTGPYHGFFIGDSPSDMEAGRKNGLTTVYANYGYGAEPGPEWIDLKIGAITELPNLVN